MDPSATGIATKTKSMFHMSCSVSTTINAAPARVWALLTDAANYTKWNSTLTSLEGDINQGGTVRMTVPQVPGRTFKIKVTEFTPTSSMTWADGFAPIFRGTRKFELRPSSEGTIFTMREDFSGLFLPMIGKMLPDFKPIFERYAADLKQAAEASR